MVPFQAEVIALTLPVSSTEAPTSLARAPAMVVIVEGVSGFSGSSGVSGALGAT